MSFFASVDPDTFTSDPAPWALVDYDYSVTRIAAEERGFEWAPRAEYRPVTAHPANPLLVAFRRDRGISHDNQAVRDDAWSVGLTRVLTILATGDRTIPATTASRRIDNVLDSIARDSGNPADARTRITETVEHAHRVITRLHGETLPAKHRSTFIAKTAAGKQVRA